MGCGASEQPKNKCGHSDDDQLVQVIQRRLAGRSATPQLVLSCSCRLCGSVSTVAIVWTAARPVKAAVSHPCATQDAVLPRRQLSLTGALELAKQADRQSFVDAVMAAAKGRRGQGAQS